MRGAGVARASDAARGGTPDKGRRSIMLGVARTPPFLFVLWAATSSGGVQAIIDHGVWPPVFLAVVWPMAVLVVGLAFRQAERDRDGLPTGPGALDTAAVAGAALLLVGIASVVSPSLGGDGMAARERQVLGLGGSLALGIGLALVGRLLLARRSVPPGGR